MKTKKTVWTPAIVAVVVAVLLMAYSYYLSLSHVDGAPGVRPHGGRESGTSKEIFKTFGTVAVFLGALSFSWFWFKKKLASPSMLVRKAGKLLHAVHKLLGWCTLIVVAIHGVYFLFAKSDDNDIYTGLAGFAILLMIVGYGLFIPKVRNKWMRTAHRVLGVIWVPILLVHAGGSAIVAVGGSFGVWALIRLLERRGRNVESQVA